MLGMPPQETKGSSVAPPFYITKLESLTWTSAIVLDHVMFALHAMSRGNAHMATQQRRPTNSLRFVQVFYIST